MYKRLVYRADDIGYTVAFDLGALKAIDEGIATSADVMFDSYNTAEVLQELRKRPWISVGWHRHLWNRPVLPPEEVPSLVDEEGRFKWRHRHPELMAEATYEDAYKEFQAEMALCIEYYGKYPDTASIRPSDLPLEKAFADVVRECGIDTGLYEEKYCKFVPEQLRPNVRRIHPGGPAGLLVNDLPYYDLRNFASYDPAGDIMAHTWPSDDMVLRAGGHPGYLDEFVMNESSCNIHRPKELEACLDPKLKQWIIDNKIELVSNRDLINGTHEYQDHLKEIASPLWVGNF
ncbi:MAG: ChbG/HpnK family deacetylase [Erysipelotrichaceae bacterium]|nr:ChbG/HpnK family deacetylase [Erysipelotrichaceae bacterium]